MSDKVSPVRRIENASGNFGHPRAGPVSSPSLQLAGANIGNSLAPVVIVLGLSAIGASRRTGEVLRLTLLPAMVLLASAVTMTCVSVAVHQ